ncbi:MAG: alpha/beta fold hydrolase [Clostridia bacterium]|nr:alpha/beta fold hydrolase [Clostridia bacterium]MBQ8926353.1 alpha/beta fold hydrolase [Clostridia bacterium]
MQQEFFLNDDGIRLHAKLDRPEGLEKCPLCIVLHGLTGHMEEDHIRAVAAAMNDLGIATLRVELYGHGQSDGAFEDHDIAKWLHNIDAATDYAKSLDFVTDLYLCGHSQGGLAAVMAAGRRPEDYKALLPLAPALMIPRLAKEFPDDEVPDCFYFHEQRIAQGYILANRALDVDAAIAAYHGPVLLVQGTNDTTIVPQDTIDAADVYDNATLVLVEGDTHCFDYHLDQVVAAVKSFFS